ncbi:hypothetical protein [Streptomyces huasconensis]|uniref:hypothetical protein n=1 Tax=Streptomyces huasconensis TaxID=1854574 RepID=UPI0036F878E2
MWLRMLAGRQPGWGLIGRLATDHDRVGRQPVAHRRVPVESRPAVGRGPGSPVATLARLMHHYAVERMTQERSRVQMVPTTATEQRPGHGCWGDQG